MPLVPPEEKPKESPLILTLPNAVTYGVWQKWNEGRLGHREVQLTNKLPSDFMTENYHGVIALFKAGMLHLAGDPNVVARVEEFLNAKDHTATPANFMNYMAKQVVEAIN